MKKILLGLAFVMVCTACYAAVSLTEKEAAIMLSDNVKVLEKGEAINYPLAENSIIECYAKQIDGSIKEFEEYNDYFIVKDGKLYSTTMQKIYKPEKSKKLKKVDRVKLVDSNKTLKLYDPLWEGSFRHHPRVVKIHLDNGTYFMKGIQDNWSWYRNAVSSGYCRAIQPE